MAMKSTKIESAAGTWAEGIAGRGNSSAMPLRAFFGRHYLKATSMKLDTQLAVVFSDAVL